MGIDLTHLITFLEGLGLMRVVWDLTNLELQRIPTTNRKQAIRVIGSDLDLDLISIVVQEQKRRCLTLVTKASKIQIHLVSQTEVLSKPNCQRTK